MTEMTFKSQLRAFAESTTVKGVGRVLKTHSWALRLLWLLAMIFGFSFALYNIMSLLLRYLEFNTVTNTNWCKDCTPEFPDITLCNLNSLSINTDDYDWSGHDRAPWPFNTYNKFVVELANNDQLKQIAEKTLNVTFTNEEWTDTLANWATLTAYFQNLRKEHANRLRLELENRFIQQCQFYDWDLKPHKKIECSFPAKTLRSFLNPQYLWCFTFDGQKIEKEMKMKNTLRGLETVIYLDNFGHAEMPVFQPDIIESKAIGVKVVIHPHGTAPDIKKGFNVAPGQEVNIKLSAIKDKWLPTPYGNCTYQEFLSPLKQFSDKDNAELQENLYTDDYCVSSCHQAELMDKCRCISAHLSITENMWQDSSLPFCSKVDIQVSSEVPTLEERMAMIPKFVDGINRTRCSLNLDHSNTECNCIKACEELRYESKVFSTPWPHQGYEMALYKTMIKPKPTIRTNFEIYEEIDMLLNSPNITDQAEGKQLLRDSKLIQDNFLQLNVYFQEKSVLIYKENEAVTVDALYGSIGGNFNLWIGISFFTVVELCELLYRLCVVVSIKGKHSRSETKVKAFVNDDPKLDNEKVRNEAYT